MNNNHQIVEKAVFFVKESLNQAEAGHNWWHIARVLKISRKIAENYKTDNLLLDLGALLHDIADAKFHHGNESIGPEIATKFLRDYSVSDELIRKIVDIIRYISYKNKSLEQPGFIEFKIIQDADRLDAIGAIGIARAFHYGGFKNREIYNPEIAPLDNPNDDMYKKSTAPTINHFYEKLFKIKTLLNTPEAKEIAKEKHSFMECFIEQFYKEWGDVI